MFIQAIRTKFSLSFFSHYFIFCSCLDYVSLVPMLNFMSFIGLVFTVNPCSVSLLDYVTLISSALWFMFVHLFASLAVVRFYGVLMMISR